MKLSDPARHQPSLRKPDELQLTALRPTNCATASFSNNSLDNPSGSNNTTKFNLLNSKLPNHEPVRSQAEKNSSESTASKLDSILEETRNFQEVELAVSNSEEERPEGHTLH